jgi:hypothetical protein
LTRKSKREIEQELEEIEPNPADEPSTQVAIVRRDPDGNTHKREVVEIDP